MSVTADAYKQALSRWTTGVTIVTARAGERVHGMTVSAFNEVSLDPPLVLVCADKSSNTHPVIEEGGCFAVNILAVGQEELSSRFASKRDEWRRFEGLDWQTASTGAPILPDSVVGLDCRVVAAHDAGDHVIYVGDVAEARVHGGEPLLYHEGVYRSLDRDPA